MFAASKSPSRRGILTTLAVAAGATLVLLAAGGRAIPSAEASRPDSPVPTAGAPNATQPPAKIIAEVPKAELLAQGVAIVPFRAENVQIVPVFGPAAAAVSPRLGHLHVTLDDAPWHWAHTSNDPVIVAPLPPGRHRILLELADADHKVLAKQVVEFDVPLR